VKHAKGVQEVCYAAAAQVIHGDRHSIQLARPGYAKRCLTLRINRKTRRITTRTDLFSTQAKRAYNTLDTILFFLSLIFTCTRDKAMPAL
jgi:hypothetical protein